MRRYELNDLLEEGDLLALTEEAMAHPARPARRVWRRAAAVAACLALVVCLANFGAIAAGVERLVRYVSGVGAVAPEEQILLQEEPAEWEHSGSTYRVQGAYQMDGYVYLTVEVMSDNVDTACTLWAQLRQDGEVLPVYFGVDWPEDYECSTTRFLSVEEWRQEYRDMGLEFAGQYGKEALALFSMTFRAGAGSSYELLLRDGPDGPGTTINLEFTDRTQELRAVQETFAIGEEPVRVSVSEDGRRVFVEMDQYTSDGLLIAGLMPTHVIFTDGAGIRYPGAARYRINWNHPSLEVILQEEPAAPVTCVEISGMKFATEDTARPRSDGERFGLQEYDNLGWRIKLD